MGHLRRVSGDLLSLTIPRGCAGCGDWDRAVCSNCRRLWAASPRRCEEDTVHLAAAEFGRARLALPTWAVAPYQGPARRMILAWKSARRPDTAVVLLAAGHRAAQQLAAQLQPGQKVVVVPAPSGWRRRAARRFVVGVLAEAVAAGLSAGGYPVAGVADVLRSRGGSIRRLSAGARRRGRRVRLRRGRQVSGPVVLVDDVVTTGATLAEARDCLDGGGARVHGALVLAATLRPGSSRWRAGPEPDRLSKLAADG